MTTATKYTPGPWDLLPLARCQAVQAGPDRRICTLSDHVEHEGTPCGSIESQDKTQDEIDANARLIAAAPELLEALVLLREWVRRPWGEDDGYANEQLIYEVEAAIAKATGTEAEQVAEALNGRR